MFLFYLVLFPFSISRCSLWFLATNLSSFLDYSLCKISPCPCLICFFSWQFVYTICWVYFADSHLCGMCQFGVLGSMSLHNSYKVIEKMSSFFSFLFCLFLPLTNLKYMYIMILHILLILKLSVLGDSYAYSFCYCDLVFIQ